MSTRILFVCTGNSDRSPTAETIYKQYPGLETKSTGILKNDGIVQDCLQWADVIVVMEKHHEEYICKYFAEDVAEKPIYTLDIPDHYLYMQDSLVQLIKERMKPVLTKFYKS